MLVSILPTEKKSKNRLESSLNLMTNERRFKFEVHDIGITPYNSSMYAYSAMRHFTKSQDIRQSIMAFQKNANKNANNVISGLRVKLLNFLRAILALEKFSKARSHLQETRHKLSFGVALAVFVKLVKNSEISMSRNL